MSICISIIALLLSATAIAVSVFGHLSRNSLTRKQIEIQDDVRRIQDTLSYWQIRKFEREEEEARASAGASFEASLSAPARGTVGLRIHNTGKATADEVVVAFYEKSAMLTGDFDPSNKIESITPAGAAEVAFKLKGARVPTPITVSLTWTESGVEREVKATFNELGARHLKFG